VIVTFYSFKGGVGRSMAVANIAEILANLGYQVIVCDWDLEAPGLERYLVNDADESTALQSNPGVIDLLNEYKDTVSRTATPVADGETPEADTAFQRFGNLLLRRPSTYAKVIPPSSRGPGGSIRFLSAGRRDGSWNARYTDTVQNLDWKDFYAAWAGDAYVDFLRKDLDGSCDIVLIDSRTGVTEHGGVCTHHLADLVVLLSAANDLNLEGTLWMAGILADERLTQLRPGRPLDVMPVAARIEQTSETDLLLQFRGRFRRDFARFLSDVVDDPLSFLKQSEIPYIPHYAFIERVVARMPPSQRISSLYDAYHALADAIVSWGVHKTGLRSLKDNTQSVARPITVKTSTAISGRFLLVTAPDRRSMGRELARQFDAAGVQILRADGAEGDALGSPEIRAAAHREDGVIITAGGDTGWLDNQLNTALRRQAAVESYRVLVLLPVRFESEPALLRRFRTFVIGDEIDAQTVARITLELLPTRPLVPESDAEASPIGRNPIGTDRARFLLGRESDIDHVHRALANGARSGHRWLVLTGAANVGKTSFIHGGLVPALRAPSKIETLDLSAITLNQAAESLNAVTLSGTETPELTSIVVIDHMERFLHSSEANATHLFTDALALALARSHERGRPGAIVSVVRSDLLPELWAHARLQPFRELAIVYAIRPLDNAQIRTVLAGYARLTGRRWESGLEDRVVLELGGLPPRALPLLLRELSTITTTDRLTHSSYDGIGGAQAVFLRSARASLESLSAAQSDVARQIFLGLVTVGEDGRPLRRILPRDEALRFVGDAPNVLQVLDELAQSGVVTISEDGHLELCSDDLLTMEPLSRWFTASSADLRLRDVVHRAAETWASSNRTDDALPTGMMLKLFSRASPRNSLVVEFLNAAEKHQAAVDARNRSDRRQRTWLWIVTAGMGVLCILILALAWQL
jgi:hypothetical protein